MVKSVAKHTGSIQLNDGTKITKEQVRKDPAKVMSQIIKQQRSLWSKSMKDLTHARALAESPDYPQRWLLYDIYEDIIKDPFIHGQIYNHRILPVKNKAFKIIEADGKENEEKTLLLKKTWFREYVKHACESHFFGHSLIYLKELSFDGSTSWIRTVELMPRKHVHPEIQIYTRYQTDLSGFDYTRDPLSNYMLPIGSNTDLGLLDKAAPMAILKKHGWQNWDEFGEIFGMPLRTVKTASQDPRVIAEIEGWLKEMGTAPYGIFPDDTEINVQSSTQSDSFKVFAEMINKANEELAILFSGQTMTSMNGSSRSQGEVHERVMAEITRDDEIFMEDQVNDYLIPLLRDKHRYPFAEGDRFEWSQPEDLEKLLKIYQGVNAMGFQVDPDQVTEKFGVRILGIKQPLIIGGDTEDLEETEPPKRKKAPTEKDELTMEHLVKLHTSIQQQYGGDHVH